MRGSSVRARRHSASASKRSVFGLATDGSRDPSYRPPEMSSNPFSRTLPSASLAPTQSISAIIFDHDESSPAQSFPSTSSPNLASSASERRASCAPITSSRRRSRSLYVFGGEARQTLLSSATALRYSPRNTRNVDR